MMMFILRCRFLLGFYLMTLKIRQCMYILQEIGGLKENIYFRDSVLLYLDFDLFPI